MKELMNVNVTKVTRVMVINVKILMNGTPAFLLPLGDSTATR